jgi:hypothetical protein
MAAVQRKNFELELAKLPALPHPLTAQQVRETDLVPDIKKCVVSTNAEQVQQQQIPSKQAEQQHPKTRPPNKQSKPTRKIIPVPLTSKKGKDKTPSSGKEKATGSSVIGKEKTPGKELDQADSGCSSIKGKEKTPGKELN